MRILKWLLRLAGIALEVLGIGGLADDVGNIREWLAFMSPFWINFTFCVLGVVLILVSFFSELRAWALSRWGQSGSPAKQEIKGNTGSAAIQVAGDAHFHGAVSQQATSTPSPSQESPAPRKASAQTLAELPLVDRAEVILEWTHAFLDTYHFEGNKFHHDLAVDEWSITMSPLVRMLARDVDDETVLPMRLARVLSTRDAKELVSHLESFVRTLKRQDRNR